MNETTDKISSADILQNQTILRMKCYPVFIIAGVCILFCISFLLFRIGKTEILKRTFD